LATFGRTGGKTLTPTARTLDLLRRSGYQAAVVEKWLPHAGVRSDLWRFGDVLAVSDRREPRFLIVQCTTLAHTADRLRKARECPELRTWLRAGGAFEVWGWYRKGKGWEVRRVAVQGSDLAEVVTRAHWRRGRKVVQKDLFEG
jgi:hypothetical protein